LIYNSFEMKSFVEKHTTWIAIGLIVISLIGGVFLMVKKGVGARNIDQRPVIEERDKEINTLKEQVASLQKEIESLKSKPVDQPVSETANQPVQNQSIGKININSATVSQLDSLPGIGLVYAQRIIEYRQSKGGFKNISEIKNVKGIGDKTFEKFKDLITI